MYRDRDRETYYAAIHPFGNRRSALSVAGINLANIARRNSKHLNCETMLLRLRDRRVSGQSLVYNQVCLEHRDHALAIRREFRSWVEAIQLPLQARF